MVDGSWGDGVVVTVHMCSVGRLNWQREHLWRRPHDAPCEVVRAEREQRDELVHFEQRRHGLQVPKQSMAHACDRFPV